jgi:NADH dehydrogenase
MKYDVLVIGGNGFVGGVLVRRLQREGYSVLLPTRHLAAARDFRLLPSVHLTQADVNDQATLNDLCSQVKPGGTVINLVGVLHDRPAKPYGKVFERAHVLLPTHCIAAMKANGIKRYLHMSALGADSHGPSMYQRSKGDGEAAVRASGLDWTIFRPSVIFGQEDQFINLFANLAKVFPVIPLANSQALFQPVSVNDVAAAFVAAITMKQTIHQTYSLVGPEVLSMVELVRFAALKAQTTTRIIPMPAIVGYLQALMFEFLPVPTLMSRDNIASMQLPNVLPPTAADDLITTFGISRQSIRSLLA